ncbi:hypothetical protein HY213_03580 [Candidatus Peregrinibacteria bacterium]|nr:hypothetical protein [Candidatus Peregrinibacteria bacterium]
MVIIFFPLSSMDAEGMKNFVAPETPEAMPDEMDLPDLEGLKKELADQLKMTGLSN